VAYSIAQYFGWQCKFVRPAEASRFHLVLMISIAAAALLILTTIDPMQLTEYSIVLAAAALPLTYLPVLIVANNREYMQDKLNSAVTNALATVLLLLLLVVSLATIPLMIVTKAGG
jgi:manganese transport protein